jgi:hypothetical protein
MHDFNYMMVVTGSIISIRISHKNVLELVGNPGRCCGIV